MYKIKFNTSKSTSSDHILCYIIIHHKLLKATVNVSSNSDLLAKLDARGGVGPTLPLIQSDRYDRPEEIFGA